MSLCIPQAHRWRGAPSCIKVLAIASQKAVPGRTRIGRSHLLFRCRGRAGCSLRRGRQRLPPLSGIYPDSTYRSRRSSIALMAQPDGILVSLREAIAAADYPYPIDQDLDELVWPRVERLI